MENIDIFNIIMDLIFIALGICLIFGRMEIGKIFKDYAIKRALYTDVQQRILFIIIWVIGIVFIFGGTFQLLKIMIR